MLPLHEAWVTEPSDSPALRIWKTPLLTSANEITFDEFVRAPSSAARYSGYVQCSGYKNKRLNTQNRSAARAMPMGRGESLYWKLCTRLQIKGGYQHCSHG